MSDSRLLIVDDNSSLVDNWQEELGGREATVSSGYSGAAALRVVDEGFDAALVDVRLPDMVGTCLICDFKAADPDLNLWASASPYQVAEAALPVA